MKRSVNDIEISVITNKSDIERFDKTLGEYHYMGETRPVGDFLRQVATCDGQWVGF